MATDKIYLSAPHMGENELKYIHEAFDTNWISTVGPQINAFEQRLSTYCGTEGAAALASGTAAIHLALKILGVSSGDKVLCQSFTFAASANPITYLGAEPVFIDSEEDTWNMDPEATEAAIKEIGAQNIKAIIPVHLYGMPAKMDEILSIGNKYGIPVIEDAAEALGSKYKNKNCGSFGDIGILSFNGNKIITTSGGGALLSDNTDYIKKVKFLATQARDEAPHYEHTHIGYNYRMGNINAAIGLGQMDVLNTRDDKRRSIYNWYRNLLGSNVEFQGQNLNDTDYYSNRWLTSVLMENFEQRENWRLTLEQNQIECRPLWKPMHMQPVFKDCKFYGKGVSELLFERGLCLPSGSGMTEDEFDRISNCLKTLI